MGSAGDVLAEARNTAVTEQDITAHPELKLALWAARHLDAEIKPPGAVSPDAAQVAYQGPALFDEARVPIDGYHD